MYDINLEFFFVIIRVLNRVWLNIWLKSYGYNCNDNLFSKWKFATLSTNERNEEKK